MAKPKTNAEGLALVLTKITRPELARRLDLSRQLLHRWDHVPLKYLLKVEQITGIPRDQILPEMAALFR